MGAQLLDSEGPSNCMLRSSISSTPKFDTKNFHSFVAREVFDNLMQMLNFDTKSKITDSDHKDTDEEFNFDKSKNP